MKKVIIALFVINSFASCSEQACVKYVKMGGKVIKESLPVTKTPNARSVVQEMETGMLRMTR
jgi:hypothetical protein